MCDARGRVQADGKGVPIGDARAVGVGHHGAEFGGAAFDLVARAVDEDDLDVERTQDGDVEQDVAEILRLDDLAVDGDHEDALAETREYTGGCREGRRLAWVAKVGNELYSH